jgi:ribose 5-phosphate isomerase A
MVDPKLLLHELKGLTGVVEVGLFVGMAKEAFFGHEVSCGVGVAKRNPC